MRPVSDGLEVRTSLQSLQYLLHLQRVHDAAHVRLEGALVGIRAPLPGRESAHRQGHSVVGKQACGWALDARSTEGRTATLHGPTAPSQATLCEAPAGTL